ncbi:hypothetical protein QUF70_14850 [Desulfobacterales bacterium HSG17]|nr:hypothetical protein [Desulfobacterales bacterium HSG17]
MPSAEQDNTKSKVSDLLETPWLGLRPDLIIHPGPIDYDGQRSWILEDPVRGNNFRLGHAEGELVYRLTTEPDVDAAIIKLYQNTTLRPTIEEIVAFINLLQRESLAVVPDDEVVRRESLNKSTAPPTFIQQVMKGNIFFRIPVLRPDKFLGRTLPWVSLLWSPFLRFFYLFCGLTGLVFTFQEIEIYLGSVSYLFTPQGSMAFLLCLFLLKAGHEFAHAYTTKAMGLHVRSMGVFFIVIWPLLYTDTTDAWKIPDRRQRMLISAAGVLFELTIAGIALLLWAFLPDGILRSLMFFLSGTSLVSSVLINLNPFMRYDGYYILMDYWGIDNLRPRAYAMFRHTMRRLFFDWQGPAPEIHPNRRSLVIYGFCAGLYKLFIGISIAISVYYLFFPILGMIIFAAEIWLFIIYPIKTETLAVIKNQHYMGSKSRLILTAVCFLIICLSLVIPLPYIEHVPSLFMYKRAANIESPSPGQILTDLPKQGLKVNAGDLITSLSSDSLEYEMQQAKFDLGKVRLSIQGLGSGGEQEAYRKWLMAEEERLKVSLEKYLQAFAQMEIRSPVKGTIMDVNQDLYKGAFVPKGAYLFTVAIPDSYELKAFVHENIMTKLKNVSEFKTSARFAAPEISNMNVRSIEKSFFPVHRMPNQSLYDYAGGPVVSVADCGGRRPREAYFTYTFEVEDKPENIPVSNIMAHGMPSWMWIQTQQQSVVKYISAQIWKTITERGFF